ncbi:MAG: LysR family transcriptional regulator [Quisquiliibacterium sp.]
MSLSIDMLSAFVKVAERRSVSAAALDLGVSKSVLSKRIAQLETTLHTTLFSRSTRRIALTPAGEAYLAHAHRALSAIGDGEEQLRSMQAELTGKIRLTAPVSWGQRVLSAVLPEFVHLHPGIEIDLVLGDRIMDLAFERIDIALRWSPQAPGDTVAIPIASIDWVIAASPGYLASAGTPVEPSDLQGHPGLCYWRKDSEESWVFERMGERVQVSMRSRYRVDNPEAVTQAALAGLGVGLLPGYLCEDALSEGSLVRLLPAWKPVTQFGEAITAVAPPERMRLARNQVLVEFLKQRLASPETRAVKRRPDTRH